ncbi:winged helix-turn-helix domain-containing protein [Micromonospora inyonensis]|uniref:GntR family transcriptional regulator n=1 Tax=Micromonospora inyonensis TaxID=47866 RepID=A0A1C6RXM5_9ACTN|nr:winged helix-turn-helix domain-containing protein [Micromonospora inyonensis]SCL21568.1 GntR family transcriptional regulator [Micromonospora inyonensis]SCL21781.1 GntR family transcriptional regulator [Micromonospora inyonensis]
MIDPRAERAVYQQLADLLRGLIASGQVKPGALLPSSKTLEQTHGVSRETVRRALAVLRGEGLVVTEGGYGTRVVQQQTRQHVRVPRSAQIVCRMPTDAERVDLGIELGEVVPVVTIHVGAQTRGPYRADMFDFTTA